MKIKKTITKCGNVLFMKKSIYRGKGSKKSRRPRSERTSEQQREVNRRLAKKKLMECLQNNFGGGSLSITLTYDKNPPETPQAAAKEIELFKRRLRYAYKKYGSELKYIEATERKNKRPHTHMIINGIDELPPQAIQEIWGNGFVRATPLEQDGYYKDLAEYLIKETEKTFSTPERIYGKRYTTSRNLIIPETIEEITEGDENDLLDIPLCETFDNEEYALIKESEYIGVNPYTGLPYVEYAVKHLPPRKKEIITRRQNTQNPNQLRFYEIYRHQDKNRSRRQ